MTKLDYIEEDEAGYGDDDLQQDNETTIKGAPLIKRKHNRTVDHVTVPAEPHDANVLPLSDPEYYEDDGDKEPDLPRTVADKTAKQLFKDKLAATDFKLPKEPKTPANDNFTQRIEQMQSERRAVLGM